MRRRREHRGSVHEEPPSRAGPEKSGGHPRSTRRAALGLMLVVLGSARVLERWGVLLLALACLMAAVAATTALLLIRR